MSIEIHDDSLRHLLSLADEMVSDSKLDQQHSVLLLKLAESYLKNLIGLYDTDKNICIQGNIYQRLAWLKYQISDFRTAEKNFLYSIVNLKNCPICLQELLISYWGLINVYINMKKYKIAKKYFLAYYTLISRHSTIRIEQDFDYVVQVLNLSAEDLLKR